VLTRRSLLTLIYVLTAVHPLVTTCTGASVRAIDGASVTDRISMARIRCAGIIQMAQQSCGTQINTAGFTWLILGVPATAVYTLHNLAVGSLLSGRKLPPLFSG